MKKITTLILALAWSIASYAQLTGMSPNTGQLGQQIVTTISGNNIFFTGSSPSGNLSYARLLRGSCQAISTNASELVINNNTISCAMTLPSFGLCTGNYDLDVQTSTNNYSLPSAFAVLPFGNSVSGNIYYDTNNNGLRDVGDVDMVNELIDESATGSIVSSLNSGQYIFPFSQGVHTFSWTPSTPDKVLSSDSASFTVNVNGALTGYDFGFTSSNADYTSAIDITSGSPRCNTTVSCNINFMNEGNVPYTGYVYVVKDPLLGFVSSSPSPSSINGDTLFFNYATVNPFVNNSITLSVLIPGTPNTQLFSKACIVALDGTGTPAFSLCDELQQIVLCSFDPNDKAVSPPGEFNQHYTLFTDTLEYLIRFQNTGNAAAFDVVVQDWLDANLDLSTFRIIGSSHSMVVDLQPSGSLTFTFNNINLPDSNSNEPLSHGWIKYRILPDLPLPANTIISNTAYIFFDSNAPVATNTTYNTLVNVIPVGINNNEFPQNGVTVMPNPMSDQTHLIFNNASNHMYFLNITTIEGKMLHGDVTQTGHFIFTRKGEPAGVYLYTITNRKGKTYKGKIVFD